MDWLIKLVLPVAGLLIGWMIRWLYARYNLKTAERRAIKVNEDAKKDAEARAKEILLEAKEKVISERNQLERETRERRADLQRYERRVTQKEEFLDRKLAQSEKAEAEFSRREADFSAREDVLSHQEARYREELERISGLTRDEAKALIIAELENEAKHDAQSIINKIEAEANLAAEKKARDILIVTLQRLAAESTGELTVSSVALPNEEMKGRIIGREGRNIRTLETLTGVDIIIDDTPEAVVLSCFDPVRREIAKVALERLIIDGRIHPARIEEIVAKVSKEISQKIFEEGERVLFEFGIHSINNDAIRALGRLYFRMSYGQNVLSHSKEVALIAGLIASELGANRNLSIRAALLHDIGKGIETDSDLNHAEAGMDMARKMGEDPRVINAIGSHHNDIEPSCIESVIVQIADAISAARPGARKDTVDNYAKRLKNLEEVATGFGGVERAFAIQAGRELRIVVHNDKVTDDGAKSLGREVAKKIEADLNYPGRIKITIIRETRIVEYAR